MIKLTDFIKTQDPSKTKIKFNIYPDNPDNPALDLLIDDSPEFIEMNAWKTKQPNNNLNNADYLIALAQYYPYGPQFYMFGGLYKVEKVIPEVFDQIGYKLTLMDEYSEYIRRLIIKIDKPIGRNLYNRLYSSVQSQLNPEVYELAPNVKLGSFRGYQNVSLKHKDLQLIIRNEEPSWKQALLSAKGIYVITDTSNGKLYIGSASGSTDGLWQRWAAYANLKDLTGGNKDFDKLVKDFGRDYIISNFKYSILEIFDTKTKSEVIFEREAYWKKVFETRKFGMNNN